MKGSLALKIPGINNKILYLLASCGDVQTLLVFLVVEHSILHALSASFDFNDSPVFKFYGRSNRLHLFRDTWFPAFFKEFFPR